MSLPFGFEIGMTVTEIRARRAVLERLDSPTTDEMKLLGVRFTATDEVPGDQLWVVAETEEGARATLVYTLGDRALDDPGESP